MQELITMPRQKYLELVEEVQSLRNTRLYKRLLEFEQNIQKGKFFTRADLGF